jgi:hypothetical protein
MPQASFLRRKKKNPVATALLACSISLLGVAPSWGGAKPHVAPKKPSLYEAVKKAKTETAKPKPAASGFLRFDQALDDAIGGDVMAEARAIVDRAAATGYLTPAVLTSRETGAPVAYKLFLSNIESGFGEAMEARYSSGAGIMHTLDGQFAQVIATYGSRALPMMAKLDPKHYAAFSHAVQMIGPDHVDRFEAFTAYLRRKGPAKPGFAELKRDLFALRMTTPIPSFLLADLFYLDVIEKKKTLVARYDIDPEAMIPVFHFSGINGGDDLLAARSNASLRQVAPTAARMNGFHGKTVGDFFQHQVRAWEKLIEAIHKTTVKRNISGPRLSLSASTPVRKGVDPLPKLLFRGPK